jgi:hypothetical protein
VDRQNFGVCLSIAGMAVQQDHVANKAREDRFLVSGLEQSGRPVVGVVAQKSAGHAIMSSLLEIVFQGSERPCIREISVVNGPYVPSANLPTLIFSFNTPQIAKEVRFRLLKHGKALPALERIFIEPSFTRATRVWVEILQAIRKCLVLKDIVSYVRKFDRSPSLVVVHDQREKGYGFVEACVAFRSMLTSDTLRFAYATAGREFVERMTSLFIVLIEGGQPLPTFTAPTVPVSLQQPSTSAAAAVVSAPLPKPSFLQQCLAPGSAHKRLHDSFADPAPSKRVAP